MPCESGVEHSGSAWNPPDLSGKEVKQSQRKLVDDYFYEHNLGAPELIQHEFRD